MKDILLDRLSGGRRVSGAALAETLGLTRAAVHKRVQALRRRGYAIDGASRLGYQLANAPDALDLNALKGPLARQIIHRETLPSTQDEAKALALAGAAEGTLVVADHQSAGRGRLGRKWSSPMGGLWFSLVLRPDFRPERAPALGLVAALALARTLRRRGVDAGLKWPNDIWVGGKKLAGLLTEMSAETDRVHWVVLGIGMNLRNESPESAAISLKGLLPAPPGRTEILGGWLVEFGLAYARYLRLGFGPFKAGFERWSVLQGKPVAFDTESGRARGKVLGLDVQGRLRLRTGSGTTVFQGGEVSLLRLQSRRADTIL